MPLTALLALLAGLAAGLLHGGRWRPLTAGLLLAAIGSGSLVAGAGTDRLDLLQVLLRPGASSLSGFVLTGLALVAAGLVLGGGLAFWRPPRGPEAIVGPVAPFDASGRVQVGLGILALCSPHAGAGLALAFLSGALALLHPRHSVPTRVALGAALAGLGIGTALLATTIGPLPATFAALQDGPIGDPAARRAMLPLLVPGTVYLAFPALAAAAAAVVMRVGTMLLPAGVLLWQGAVLPGLLIVMIVTSLRGARDLTLLALAGYGLWTGAPVGQAGGLLLLLAAAAPGALPRLAALPGGTRVRRALLAAGLVLVVSGGMQVQVVYTMLLAGAAAMHLLRPAAVVATT